MPREPVANITKSFASTSTDGAPLEFLDLVWVESVTLDEWNQLFSAAGWPIGLVRSLESHEAILRSLMRPGLPDDLLDALQLAYDLASADGIEELTSTALSKGITVAHLGDSTRLVPFVLRLWQRALRSDGGTLKLVLRLAQLAMHRRSGPSKSLRQFVSEVAVPSLPAASVCKKRLVPAIKNELSAVKMGPLFDLVVDDSSPTVIFLVIYGGREHQYLVSAQTRTEKRVLSFVGCDAIHYDPRDRRLAISTRSRTLVDAYRRAFGSALFGDDDQFSAGALWSLGGVQSAGFQVLHDHGMELLIPSVRVSRAVWRADDDTRVVVAGSRCSMFLDKLHWQNSGELLELGLELQVRGARPNKAVVSIKVPDRLSVRPERHRALVERFARAVGIGAASTRQLDLWSVASGVHGDDDMEQALNATIAQLHSAGILTPAIRRIRRDSEGAAQEVTDEEIDGKHHIFTISDDEVVPASDDHEESVIRGWSLHLPALAAAIAVDLRLVGAPFQIESALFDLGTRTIDGTIVRVVLAAREFSDVRSLAAIEERRTDGSRVVVLVPPRRVGNISLRSIEWDLWRPPFDAIWPRVLRALGIVDSDPWKEARPGMELVIHETLRRVRCFGVEIDLPGSQGLELLLLLAGQKPGEPHTTAFLAHRLTGENATPHQVYMLKKRTLDAIKASLKAASRLIPASQFANLIRRVRRDGGGFEIGVPFEVLRSKPSK